MRTPRPKKPKLSQAQRLFAKFGGPSRLYEILKILGCKRNKASIYKWDYSREKGGSGGLIPTSAWSDVLAAARFDGVIISSHDLDPRMLEEE